MTEATVSLVFLLLFLIPIIYIGFYNGGSTICLTIAILSFSPMIIHVVITYAKYYPRDVYVKKIMQQIASEYEEISNGNQTKADPR